MRMIAAVLVAITTLGAAPTYAQDAAPPAPPQYAPPPPQYAPPAPQYPPSQYAHPYRRADKQRDTWYIGFGLAGGNGSVKDAAGTSSFKEFFGKSPTTVGLNFKVGATLTPRLLLGGDITGINSEAEEGGASASLTITNIDAVATFFPMERGLYVRGGVGLSRLVLDVDSPLVSGSSSYTGTNVLGGIGYALWLGQSFNLAINLDYSAQFYGDNDGGTTGPQRSSFWTLGLGFDWY